MTARAPERGTAVMETVLVMFPLMVFLFLSPAVWKMWFAEQHTRVRAHRHMFLKAHLPVNNPADFSIPFLWGGRPATPAMPNLRPRPDRSLRGYSRFPNDPVEGRHIETVQYSIGLPNFRGEFDMKRYSYIIRSPWTWNGWPFRTTQYANDHNVIKRWYDSAYDQAMTQTVQNQTHVDIRPR